MGTWLVISVMILPVWAALADLLVSKRPTQDLGDHCSWAVCLQALIKTVYQTVEELKGIVLLSEVHLLTPQSREGKGMHRLTNWQTNRQENKWIDKHEWNTRLPLHLFAQLLSTTLMIYTIIQVKNGTKQGWRTNLKSLQNPLGTWNCSFPSKRWANIDCSCMRTFLCMSFLLVSVVDLSESSQSCMGKTTRDLIGSPNRGTNNIMHSNRSYYYRRKYAEYEVTYGCAHVHVCVHVIACTCECVCMFVCVCGCACLYVCVGVHDCTCVCGCACLYVHVCMWVYMFVHVCEYMFVCACLYVSVYVCTCMWVHVCMWLHVWVHACLYVCECMHVCMCVSVCACLYMCMWVCVYMHVCVWEQGFSKRWECSWNQHTG